MKSAERAAGRKKIVFLCGGITLAVLLVAAFVLTLRAYLGTQPTAAHEATAATEILFTMQATADSEATTVETIALSDLLARSKADVSETEATIEAEEETAETLSTTAEPPETEPPATEALPEAAADGDTESGSYILNTNTKKFHFPSCASVETIKPKNKSEYTGAREDLIAQGYSPCKRCNP